MLDTHDIVSPALSLVAATEQAISTSGLTFIESHFHPHRIGRGSRQMTSANDLGKMTSGK
jgi:hypothetical protein